MTAINTMDQKIPLICEKDGFAPCYNLNLNKCSRDEARPDSQIS